MKKIFTIVAAALVAANLFAYDQATEGTEYYGSQVKAIGLADGTVAISDYYLPDGSTEMYLPATVQVWNEEVMTAEYEVSQVGYWDGQMWVSDGSDANAIGNVTAVYVAEGIKTIKASALWGISAATTLSLPTTLTSVGSWAFGGATALTEIRLAGTPLPNLTDAENPFPWALIENASCKVIVPDDATKEACNQDPWTYWTGFYAANLVEVASQTPTENIEAEAAEKAHKVVRDGQVYILRDGKRFNICGSEVK